ncbi:cinnamoyl-CoA reductase [Aspergillus vadensis CBS 113365]|uniref:Cinnamoyl-CoA reductase n=1 Tax=Aspergillus vadensis (strain CBS 113365 / IMI 142717 / IBT 24658) TaxID=1448311 RepID=A0A319AVI5_ASPVC|nr:cinnamoyl-CoA reductase [Aspergillus vadensis CBS 113365]PYH63705.1 cinnamoyl-CoA reductase [Aspergillus vadensis CBS 113365]
MATKLLDRNCPSRITPTIDRELAPILKLNTCPSTMTTLTKTRTIVVLGATGNQGSGVVRALLQKNPYHPASFSVRAVTRDPSSPQAERLRAVYPEEEASGRLQLVPGDVYDVTSLERAFDGVWGVFAVTNNRLPGQMIETEEDLEHELVAGRNIVAAAKVSEVRHFVISSLPNLADASNGQFQKVFHFDHKFQIEQLAKSELTAVTALRPGLFYTNVQWVQYCRRNANGIVRFCPPVPPNKTADWTDPSYDIGIYAAGTFDTIPQSILVICYVVSSKMRFADLPAIFSTVRHQSAIFDPISLDDWGAAVARTVGKGYEEDIRQMMEWIAVAPDEKICYGTMTPKEDCSWADLGVRASTFEDWLRRSGWQGP